MRTANAITGATGNMLYFENTTGMKAKPLYTDGKPDPWADGRVAWEEKQLGGLLGTRFDMLVRVIMDDNKTNFLILNTPVYFGSSPGIR